MKALLLISKVVLEEHVFSTLEKELVKQHELKRREEYNILYSNILSLLQKCKRLFLYLKVARRRKNKSRNRFYIFCTLVLLVGLFGYREWKKYDKKKITLINLGELPSGYLSFGIDVSHHQGEIDWDDFVDCNDSTIRFVYCKATEGETHVDSQWRRNRKNLLHYNIPNGAYHFFQPKKNPSNQAKHFLNHYNIQDNDLPPVLDAEIMG